MKISAVYIAKNEAHNMARSLESIKGTVDELILVDTGSTDETVNIFRSYGGQVFFQAWQNDFSAPRNLALSKATGEWIIILDADESFSDDTRHNIRAVLEAAAPEVNGFLVRMINLDKDTGKALDEFYALRLVRNISGLNYKGRVHEMMHIGDDYFYGLQRVSPELLSIDHTGYTASISVEKNRRNISLMEGAIADGEPEERYYTSLYESYSALGDMEKALHYARLDVARGRQPVTYASRSYRGLLSYYAKDNSPEARQERLKLAAQAAGEFPELPDFHAEYSECLYQLGRYGEAKQEMELALSLMDNYDGMEPCLLTPEMIPVMKKRQQEMTALAEVGKDFRITACAIVKDEEANIYGWLKNVGVYADEIVINDTGSQDKTKELISQFSEENPDLSMVLIESQWQDDFAWAKNQCLAEATGDWVVFTDADELFAVPENIRNVLAGQQNTKNQVIMVPMANVDRDDNNNIINIFNVPRIFRRETGLSYEGRIHERITIGGRGLDQLKVFWADNSLFMEHTGYSSGLSRKKAERNLALLLKDIQEGQNIEKLYRYLAESYYALGDYNEALNKALLATQSAYQPVGQQGDMYWLALNAMEKLEYSMDDRLAIVDNGQRLFPELPDFYGRRGMIEYEAEKYHAALKSFEQAAEKLAEYNRTPINAQASNIMSVLHLMYADWAGCLYRTGHSQAAEEKYQEALGINPWTETALCGWADIYQGRADKGLLQKLANIYDSRENSRDILESIFAANGFPELAGYYGGEGYDWLIGEKSYDTIYNKSMKEIAEILPGLYVCLLESYNDEYVKLLPENLRCLVDFFHDRPVSGDIKQYYGDYRSFGQEVVALGTPELLTKYLDRLEAFSDNQADNETHLLEMADVLVKSHHENLALELYRKLPPESVHANGKLWHKMGVCLFDLGQYEAAMEYFKRADKTSRNEAFTTWCQEAIRNGN